MKQLGHMTFHGLGEDSPDEIRVIADIGGSFSYKDYFIETLKETACRTQIISYNNTVFPNYLGLCLFGWKSVECLHRVQHALSA